MKKTLAITILVFGLMLGACVPVTPAAPAATEVSATQPTEASTADPITANTWQWEKFTGPAEQYDVPEPDKYTLAFLDDGKTAVIYADCNTLVGTYTFNGQSLKINPDKSSLVACSPESLSDKFLSFLESAAAYSVTSDRMQLDLPADGGTLEFGIYDQLAAEQALLKAASWEDVLNKSLASCDAPGGVLLVDTPQGRFLKAQGLASKEAATPLTTADSFEIGSNTKSFTTVLALQLQEQGLWSLDDPLAKYLPEQASKLPYGDKVTLRQLARNNSGIPDYANAIIGNAISNGTIEQGYKPEDLVDYVVKNLKPSFEPGQGWEYSTTNFVLLGMAVEKVTGKPLSELYQKNIFEPLGMTHSFLLEGVPQDGQIVQGYYTVSLDETQNVTKWNGSQGWAGGGIVSTAEDMAKYAAGLSSGAVFKDPASLGQFLDFGDGTVAYFDGYGLGVGRWSRDPLAWGHAGQTPGFQTLWAVYPEQKSIVVFLTNSGSCSVDSIITVINASLDLFAQKLP